MNKIRNKFVIVFLAAAMILSFQAPISTQAQTTDDELDQIRQIAEDLGIDVSVLLESMDVGEEEEETNYEELSIDGVPDAFRFNENLREGVRGNSVRYLQILLNTDPDTRVASSGAGSPGNETEYFGPRTEAAVIRFQEKYSNSVLAPYGLSRGTGFVGTTTRRKLNDLLTSETEMPDDNNLSEVLEQLQQLATALQNLQSRLDEIEDDVDNDLRGDEGYLDVSQLSRPRTSSVDSGERDVEVLGTRFSAEDSDIAIQRVEVDLFGGEENASWDNGSFDDPQMVRTLIRDISLWVDGEEVANSDVDRSTVGRGSEVTLRISGLNIEIEEGDSVDMVVAISAENDEVGEVRVELGNDSIRFIDGAGINQTVDGDSYRNFSIREAIDEVTIESTGKIDEGIVTIDEDQLNEVEMLEFEITPDQDIYLETLGFYLEDDEGYFDLIALHDEDGFVEDVDVDESGDYIFDVDMDLDGGETYTFSVMGETWDIVRENQGGTAWVDIIESGTYAIDTYDDDVEGWDIDADGEELAIYVVRPELTLDSRNTDLDLFGSSDQYGDGIVTFDMEAINGDVLLDYILFRNTGNGDLTSPVLTYDGDEYDDYVELDGYYGNFDGDVPAVGEYYVVRSIDDNYTGDAKPGDVVTENNSDYEITDYRTSPMAGLGDFAFDLTSIDELDEDRDVEISVAGIIENSGSRERIKVMDVGWVVEDYDGSVFENHFNFDTDFDFIDDLETPREYIVN
ncbi:MAG: peptidoglycan-binding domain-containing protein [Patescibacteria group bacterium]